ncbi:COR domain-containing protein [Iningainema tapete]|uniref:non-specific serine/threonine protein kinase n=1 Tax=Iningainema tapete BLCC-T55 TaxID=2748662 RepID=A0A8J6XKP3_9CYAN|nr:COR domain-containing protein [Iningainema tapete]MBD2778670.1 leucine-rich repeat domain-containing protein [Iningainema tapete BLCC-T55]
MTNTPRWVIEKIREVKEKQLKKLDLTWYYFTGDIKLNKIPPEIFELKWLEELDLSGNNITELPNLLSKFPKLKLFGFRWEDNKPVPDWLNQLPELKVDLSRFGVTNELPNFIFSLTNLTVLDLSYNKLTIVPQSVTRLTNLTQLDLSNNKLTTVPESLTSLTNLTELDLSWNKLTTLPESLTSLTNLTELDLSYNQLTTLPESLTSLTNLTELDLSYNQLTTVPESLTNLTKLYLSGNQLTTVPESLTRLTNLTHLDLSRNQLTTVPETLTRLTNLTELNLSENQLTTVPETLTRLTNLTTLYLSRNQLTTVPESLTRLTNLTTLYLSENQLTTVPETLTRLTNLTELNLSENQLTTVPETLTRLTNLTTLYLSRNQLTTVPESLTRLTNLTTLYLSGNPLEKPPLEIAEKGIIAIREYFQQIAEEGLDYLYEAKLLIIGEGGAGKTTLAKKIDNQDYQLQEEDTTKGIEVTKWSFPIENSKDFRVSIWDFGGQEIYHTTHQFFLTKRSLYLLVADTRKEDTDFYYWLNTVELLAEDSPLIIIENEKQDRRREINENQLRGQFSNLKETVRTNLKDNRGYNDILKSIKYYIQSLPHVGSALPKTWVKVREALEQDSRNYISLDEYIKVCEQHGFKQHKDKLQLSGYLHDLGVFLHFQDDALLKKTVILKPKWGTTAVYKLLDSDKVASNLGRFTKSDLQDIWCEEEYMLMHDELLRLMCKFRLAYEIPDNLGNYVAPQLLSNNQPEYNWDGKGNLILRYTYTFMPKGIITQFIVVMHRLIHQQKEVWKTGVILSKDDTKAEVIEYYGKREIQIRVTGKYKRDLMTNVIYELDKIHSSYKKLKYEKLIPCNCPLCYESESPHFYEYNLLKRKYYHKGNQATIECGKEPDYNEVKISELIDDTVYDSYNIQEKPENIREKPLLAEKDDRIRSLENMVVTAIQRPSICAETYNSQGDTMSDKSDTTYNLNQPKFGGGFAGTGGTQTGGTLYDNSSNQNLAEAAAQIQELLTQLEQSYPSNTTTGKMAIATEAIKHIESDPTIKSRILSALKSGGIQALAQLLNHPAASFVIGALEDWQKTEDV